jgi:hypothetical protein
MIQSIRFDANSMFGRNMNDSFWLTGFLADNSLFVAGLNDKRTLLAGYNADGCLARPGPCAN